MNIDSYWITTGSLLLHQLQKVSLNSTNFEVQLIPNVSFERMQQDALIQLR